MAVQLTDVVGEKILAFLANPPSGHTRRDAVLPNVTGKAVAVIGMRRAGKTTYLHQIREEKLAAGRTPERLIYFNFEDERLGNFSTTDLQQIPEVRTRLFPEESAEPVTLFLDEIQLVEGWETFVRRMLDTPGYEIYLSGSSAKLLSREIATSMRGRGWEVPIHPFSFREYLRHLDLEIPDPDRMLREVALRTDHHFHDFLMQGGFPEAQEMGLQDRRLLLQGYVDTLMLRDVIERHGVSNPTALRWMIRRLLSSPAGLFSVTKFAADLKSQAVSVGRETLYQFLEHLEDAFLVHPVRIASDSEKAKQVNPTKVYPADQGLIPVFDRSGKANLGHALETAVFVELQRRRAEVGYVKTKSGYEVDFLARLLDGREVLVQVSATIEADSTRERELRALEEAGKQYPQAEKLLLTANSRLDHGTTPGVRVMSAWEWMLGET